MSILESIDEKEARMKNPLVLAYVGDTVYDLYIRTYSVKKSNASVYKLNCGVCGIVNARAQAKAAEMLKESFTEVEADIYRRGRNAKSGTTPKNMDIIDYRKATGLEAVFGYLFLTGQKERIEEFFIKILEDKENAQS